MGTLNNSTQILIFVCRRLVLWVNFLRSLLGLVKHTTQNIYRSDDNSALFRARIMDSNYNFSVWFKKFQHVISRAPLNIPKIQKLCKTVSACKQNCKRVSKDFRSENPFSSVLSNFRANLQFELSFALVCFGIIHLLGYKAYNQYI